MVALFAALGLKAAGVRVSRDSLTRAVQLLGVSAPDPWILEGVWRLATNEPAVPTQPEAAPSAPVEAEPEVNPRRDRVTPPGQAFYLYAIGRGDGCDGLACRGIEGQPVTVTRVNGWFALVHECEPQPYASDDREQVIRWIEQHHAVVEQAAECAGDLIPVAFDTIIHKDGVDALAALKQWVSDNTTQLEQILALVSGCREYGVQLLREPGVARSHLLATRPDLKELQVRLSRAPASVAYLLQKDMDRQVRSLLEDEATQRTAALEQALHRHARAVRSEKLRDPEGETEMVANFSCLVPNEAIEDLLDALRSFESSDGYSVRVTGPWPPYSFVNLQPQRGEAG
ncbi:GvpL/GvpF family gas vesicle protein [Carboxydochorda subterranea]|uniref:GvpL/GvpF family gas vesicle protein n=1 Tax=Carboxydichorda subterranea TaxID=3109565 RepID=A0ABZ1BXC2_9FIRM|nr:GvpL/GvpF family gas vesicle protein [Limnochorda sp. L945t]WRP17417.1 GvpL/GvpF family gas vesicle protein [Limnochorda sp. L945t]